MFRHYYFVILFLLTVNIGCGNGEKEVFTNEPDGFRNYIWGTKFDGVPELEIIGNLAGELNVSTFTAIRNHEDLNFNGVQISGINYYFENTLLIGVILIIENLDAYNELKQFCFEEYGKRENKSIYRDEQYYQWDGKVSNIILKKNPKSSQTFGYLKFESSVLNDWLEIGGEISKLSPFLLEMKNNLKLNRREFCHIIKSKPYVSENDSMIDANKCMLYDMVDKETREVYKEIKNTKTIKPDYYYFSVFLEDYTYDETLYSENQLGLFLNLDKCNEFLQFAVSRNIPTRQCRSWKSYTEYMDEEIKKLHDLFVPEN